MHQQFSFLTEGQCVLTLQPLTLRVNPGSKAGTASCRFSVSHTGIALSALEDMRPDQGVLNHFCVLSGISVARDSILPVSRVEEKS